MKKQVVYIISELDKGGIDPEAAVFDRQKMKGDFMACLVALISQKMKIKMP